MTRADEVRRLAEALQDNAVWSPLEIAQRLYDAGARMPEPPAQRNPISRETAHAIYEHFNGGESTQVNPRVSLLRDALGKYAPSLVADLAEAAKGPHGLVVVQIGDDPMGLRPAALVAALTRADA